MLSTGFGQTKRPVLIGIDIAKPILSLITPNRPAFRLAEATLKIPAPNQRFLSFVAGYGQLRSGAAYRNTFTDAQGVYLKIGSEQFVYTHVAIGWHGLAALTHESATYFFSGPTFGDYSAPAYDRRRVAVGLEGFASYQRVLSKRWVGRITGRITAAGLLGPRNSDVPIRFVPGVGIVTGDSPAYSVGLGVHLLYRTNPAPSASLK